MESNGTGTLSPNPIVPPEISDNIIDFLAPPTSSSTDSIRACYTPDDKESLRIRTLLACTTVSHNWLPRARTHLYSMAWVDSESALRSLIRTLESEPDRRVITRFVVAPRVWESLDPLVQGYLSVGKFLAINPQVRHLVFCNFAWDDYPPLAHIKLLPPKNCIEHLQLSSVLYPGIRNLFAFIRSFKSLSALSIIGILFDKPTTELDILTMQAHPRPWAASSLRMLEIGGPGQGIIPSHAVRLLGTQIEHLKLAFHVGSPIDTILPPYTECISTYTYLKSLRITLQPWMSQKKPLVGSIDEGAQVWGPIHDFLLDLISAVRSPTLDTLSVRLLSQQGDPEDTQDLAGPGTSAPWDSPCRYRHTRSGVLDTLFANDVRIALTSHPFARLATFRLIVYDNAPHHDEEWWNCSLKGRVPDLRPDVVRAVIRPPTDSNVGSLWEQEPGEPVVRDEHGV